MLKNQETLDVYRKLYNQNLETIGIILQRIKTLESELKTVKQREKRYKMRRKIQALYSHLNELRRTAKEIEDYLYAWGDEIVIEKRTRNRPVEVPRRERPIRRCNSIPRGAIVDPMGEQGANRKRKKNISSLLAGRGGTD